jgi:hypothetical protein
MNRPYEVEVTWPNLPNRWVVLVEERSIRKCKGLRWTSWCNCGSSRFKQAERIAQRLAYIEARRRFPQRQHPEARLVALKDRHDKHGMLFPAN